MNRLRTTICNLALVLIAGGVAGPVHAVSSQSMALLIDNSGSMEAAAGASDPLRMRGVGACMLLDAAELDSDVDAVAIFFDDGVETEGRLVDPADVRERLQGDRWPAATGNTNMQAALEKGLSVLAGSTADERTIVLITDGVPALGRGGPPSAVLQEEILTEIVPQAVQAGIRIFALGMSAAVDRAFLDELTVPTGGRALVSESHVSLLHRVNELVGFRRNVFTLKDESVPSHQMEYEFELPPGVDRARVSVILDNPNTFSTDQLEIDIEGPDSGDGGRRYLVHNRDRNWVAAWTGYVSSPGSYRLRFTSTKPGVDRHLGLRVFVEALSNLGVELVLSPPLSRFTYDDTVGVQVLIRRGSGSVDPVEAEVRGTVLTPDKGSVPIRFAGDRGTFTVPEVRGRHRVKVTVETSSLLGEARAEVTYDAVPPDAAVLQSSPERLTFSEALGPEHREIEATFSLLAVFPEEAQRRPVRIAATLFTPAGSAELLTADGGRLRTDGVGTRLLPEKGLDLKLRISMEPDRPLSVASGGPYNGEIRFFSQDATEVSIPFELLVREPKFELAGFPEVVSLWWDPERQRRVGFGKVRTDSDLDSRFRVEVPTSVYAPDGGSKIGDLELLIDSKPVNWTSDEAGTRVYGPIELEADGAVALELLITPTKGWRSLPRDVQPFELMVRSEMGMETGAVSALRTYGGLLIDWPVLGPLSRHGRHLATWLLCGLGLVVVGMRALRHFGTVASMWRFRPGTTHFLRPGTLRIGNPRAGGGDGLVLPAGGGSTPGNLALVSVSGNDELRIEDLTAGRLLVDEAPITGAHTLLRGSSLAVVDPGDEDEREWVLDYFDLDREEGGEMEVLEAPGPITLSGAVRKLAVGLLVVLLMSRMLGWGWLGSLAYLTPGIGALHAVLFS